MKKIIPVLVLGFLAVHLPRASFGQAQEGIFAGGPKIKTGARIDYFSRKITWDDKARSSDLESFFLALETELSIREDFRVGLLAGYSRSSFDGLVFRELPFSVELDAGKIGGIVVGASMEKDFLEFSDFEIAAGARFVYYMGKEKEWELPGLAVEGSVAGRSRWAMLSVGPVITFTGLASFSPYLRTSYNNLWGTFSMEQALLEEGQTVLGGEEDKKIRAKGLLEFTFGGLYEAGGPLSFRGEFRVIPYGDGMDMALSFLVLFSF